MKIYQKTRLFLIASVVPCFLLTACQNDDSDDEGDADNSTTGTTSTTGTAQNGVLTSEGSYDIYNATFSERSVDCSEYVNEYDANPMDLQNSSTFNADVFVSATDSECTIASNSVPNHDFNDDTAAFAGGQEGATITPQ